MTKETSPDRLDQYTRNLLSEGPVKARLYASPILPEEKSLFETIDQLWENLETVEPGVQFTSALHEQLMQEARREQTRQQLGIQEEHHRSRTPWIASAAALGAAATLAGAFAYWRWSSSRQAA
jgi:hypothetical protein